jgi:hypothetical protein
MNTIVGTYRWGRFRFEVIGIKNRFSFIYRHLEYLGLDRKQIKKIFKLLLKYPRLLLMNPVSLLGFIVEYFI